MVKKVLNLIIILCFFLTTLNPVPKASAAVLNLPVPGTMVNLSPAYEPVIIKGLTVHKDNPFLFDFMVDVGQDKMSGEPLKKEGEKLIKYFLASLAIPDKDLWVNLSPYEKDRMIPEALGQTDMGRDLLEEDYILKQITASLIYPEKQLGKNFWDRVYAQAQEKYGTTQIPVNTFNKVWIMADRAQVFEHDQTAFVVGSHLKVMLEEDYLALQKHSAHPSTTTHSIASQIVRQIILPQLEKEVNTGKNFANLRQIFNSIILSSWYKRNLKEALLNQVYANKSKIKGINLNDPTVKQQIYEQYLQAYKKGVFNYIKEDVNTAGAMIPRKYFSGGTVPGAASNPEVIDNAMVGAEKMGQQVFNGEIDFRTGINTNPLGNTQVGNPDAAMTRDGSDVEWTVKRIVAKRTKKNISDNLLDKSIEEELGADSLTFTEIIMEIEDKFDVNVSDEDVKNLKTTRDIINYIETYQYDRAMATPGMIRDTKGLNTNKTMNVFPVMQWRTITRGSARIPILSVRPDAMQMWRLNLSDLSDPALQMSIGIVSPKGKSYVQLYDGKGNAVGDGIEINDDARIDVWGPFFMIDEYRSKIYHGKRSLRILVANKSLTRHPWMAAWDSRFPVKSIEAHDKGHGRLGDIYNVQPNEPGKVTITFNNFEKLKLNLSTGFPNIHVDAAMTRDRSDIEKKVKVILARYAKVIPDNILLDSLLKEDLKVSKGNFFKIIMDIEYEFDISISDKDVEKLKTIKDMINYIEAYQYDSAMVGTYTNPSDVEGKVRAIVAEFTKKNLSDILLDSPIEEGLGADSLTFTEIIMKIEDAFHIIVTDRDVDNLKTTRDMINYIDAQRDQAKQAENFKEKIHPDAAMRNASSSDKATAAFTRGGIDLNTANGMQWQVSKDGNGVVMNVDAAMIARIRREGIDSLSPVILKMTPVASVWPLMGLQVPARV